LIFAWLDGFDGHPQIMVVLWIKGLFPVLFDIAIKHGLIVLFMILIKDDVGAFSNRRTMYNP
jgi:hypothetical protein